MRCLARRNLLLAARGLLLAFVYSSSAQATQACPDGTHPSAIVPLVGGAVVMVTGLGFAVYLRRSSGARGFRRFAALLVLVVGLLGALSVAGFLAMMAPCVA